MPLMLHEDQHGSHNNESDMKFLNNGYFSQTLHLLSLLIYDFCKFATNAFLFTKFALMHTFMINESHIAC